MHADELAALLRTITAQTATSATLSAVTESYLASREFTALAPTSRKAIARVLRRWLRLADLAERPIAQLARADIVRSLDPWTLGSRNTVFRRIRVLLRWAIQRGFRPDDPTVGLAFKPTNAPRPEWTAAAIERYRAYHPQGTRARLILELALAIGQRRGDLTRLRWTDITQDQGGQHWLALVQSKTKTALSIPLLPDLVACLAAVPVTRRRGHLLARTASYGRAITATHLGNLFESYAEAAGCPGRLHGLRRYCCTRLAEAGATPHQIAAISGHQSLAMVSLYTKAVRQRDLAAEAIKLLR